MITERLGSKTQLIASTSFLLSWSVLLFLGRVWTPTVDVHWQPIEDQFKFLSTINSGAVKVMVVIGTRPEAIKMAPVIQELRRRSNVFAPVIVSTGQHSEMLRQVLKAFDMQNSVDIELNLMTPNQTLERITELVLGQISRVLRTYRPNLVLVQGDTTTAFATALAAFYEKIPVGHVEAGLRTNNLYSPFPEEYNRVAIADIAQFHFAATRWAATNLANEGRNLSNVYVTGNTVVDALQYVLQAAQPTELLMDILQRARSLGSKLVLLTAHRRESHGEPLRRILTAISNALQQNLELVVIYPVHLNPNVRASIDQAFGSDIVDRLFERNEVAHLDHLRRFLIEPLTYTDMTILLSNCDFVITDSGGVQEEAVSLGKPTVVLRDNTERPEGVQVGAAVLVGSNQTAIVSKINELFTNSEVSTGMQANVQVYGDGHAAEKIVDILEQSMATENSSNISAVSHFKRRKTLVLTLTIWRRDMLEKQLDMIRYQEGLENYRIKIIIYQNGAHFNFQDHIKRWNNSQVWKPHSDVEIRHIQSVIETGYYGRFLAPLAVEAGDDDYFILFDDDMLWGKRYLWNMLRLVDEGFFATRNGRFINPDYGESAGCSAQGWDKSDVWFDDDVEYDFGGHIWAGKVGWLRTAWQHPPPSLMNNEDFWISAVLKTQLGIRTKKPRCPRPSGGHGSPDLCACSAMVALQHVDGQVGETKTSFGERWKMVELFVKTYGYTLLTVEHPELVTKECDVHHFDTSKSTWEVKGTLFEDCFGWS